MEKEHEPGAVPKTLRAADVLPLALGNFRAAPALRYISFVLALMFLLNTILMIVLFFNNMTTLRAVERLRERLPALAADSASRAELAEKDIRQIVADLDGVAFSKNTLFMLAMGGMSFAIILFTII